MGLARYLVEAHLVEGLSVSQLADTHGVHRSWIYKLIARYREGGLDALEPRSRAPKKRPNKISLEIEDEIVALRKSLSERGLDAGAHTIHWHLSQKFAEEKVPSITTIWRALKRNGLVSEQPKKRPKSSFIRFEADLPNELWQSDMTHWTLKGDRKVEIVNFIDDHSRFCLASVVLEVARSNDVLEIFTKARGRYGTPKAVLTDNGCIYTARYRGGKVAMEKELDRLGVHYKHSRPYHPQTCGKVERFHQTLKRYLAKQPEAGSIPGLQAQIDAFAENYNSQRPHRALDRRTPSSVFDSKIKASPDPDRKTKGHYRVRQDKVDTTGSITLRYQGRLHHIGIGRAFAGTQVRLLIADLDIRVITEDGELIRQLTLDRTRDYQPLGRG